MLPRCFRRLFVGALFVLVVSHAQVVAQPRYAIVDLGTVGVVVSVEPFDTIPISSTGRIALWNQAPDRMNLRALRWDSGVLTDLGTLSGDPAAKAWGMNEAGQIVGSSGSMTPNGSSFSFTRRRGFLFTGGALQEFSTLATAAYGINDSGAIVGEAQAGPFLFSNGVYRSLATANVVGGRAKAINARGQIAGTVNLTSGARHAFFYDNGTLQDLGTLGGINSGAEAINASGVVVGWTNVDASTTVHAFRYENGTMTEIPSPVPVLDMRATAINGAGQIVGFYRSANPLGNRAFLYRDGALTSLSDLVTLRTGVSPGFSEILYGCGINDAGFITALANYSPGAGASEIRAVLLVPAGSVTPASPTIVAGTTVVLTATSNLAVTSYQWLRNGVAIAGATQPTLAMFDAGFAQAGFYTCRFNTANGEYLSTEAALTVTNDPAERPSRLSNLSVLTSLNGAADGFTVATVVGGGAPGVNKPLLVRAVGPSLASLDVPGVLADPRLEFFNGATKADENDNWNGASAVADAATRLGAFALQSGASRDAALFLNTLAGDRSVRISGTGAGAVIAEIYDATPADAFTTATPRLTNLSVIKPIGTGLTAGFVIAGGTARTVLIRAVGPTLAQLFSVPNTLVDPKVALYAGQTKLAENDNWGSGASGERANEIGGRVGAFALAAGSRDSALVVTLAPGNYTVEVTGVGGTTGTALVEVYEVP